MGSAQAWRSAYGVIGGADAAFFRRFDAAGFRVEKHVVRARSNGKGPRHMIWVGALRGAQVGVKTM